MKLLKTLSLTMALLSVAAPASSEVPEEEAQRLERDLTPMGAERTGNAAGTIPAWEGGLAAPPEGLGYEKGGHHPDPFAADKPLYTVTPVNMAQYAAQLTDGHKAMLAAYPDSFFLPVYASRRSCAFPPQIYQAVRSNAVNGKMVDNENGVTGALMATPFPIPQSAREILWNHELGFRGFKVKRPGVSAVPTKNGDYTLESSMDQFIFRWSDPAIKSTEELDNMIIYVRKEGLTPPSNAGSVFVMHSTLDQAAEERRAWFYKPGERKVKRLTAPAYDNPIGGSENLRVNDNMAVFNGAGDRFDWLLHDKQEKLIPYNLYRLASPELAYKDILHKHHVNPEPMRYELHRTWVVEGRLKAGQKHAAIARRQFYFDEDSWIPAVADLYNHADKLYRVQEGHVLNYYDQPLCLISSDVVYDLDAGRYHIMGLRNHEGEIQFDANLEPESFSPEAMRRSGVR